MSKIIAIANQKGGVDYVKLHITLVMKSKLLCKVEPTLLLIL